jgi:1-deoxy-D-xylulose-5-phosphate reductoisomerase
MVEYTDGSTIAQLSMPDMRLPIGYALGWPARIATPYGRIDWTTLGSLDFEAPDRETFRCLDLAYAAGRAGGTAPAVLSAANEVVVEAFLDDRITWSGIAGAVESALAAHNATVPRDLDDVLAADAEGRRRAQEVLAG